MRTFFTDVEHRHLLGAAEVHQMRRGNKCAAAHFLRMILAKDDHARTMHAYAKRGERQQSGETPGANTSPLNAPPRPPTNASSVTAATVVSVTMATGWSFRPSVAARNSKQIGAMGSFWTRAATSSDSSMSKVAIDS